MLIYEDIITGDELFSDAFPIKEVDDIVYEVECAMIVVKEGDVDTGANPSAEAQEEALADGGKQVINLVHSSRLQQVSAYNPKEYWLACLEHFRRLAGEPDKNGSLEGTSNAMTEERKKEFMDKAKAHAKKIGKEMLDVVKKNKDKKTNDPCPYDFYVANPENENSMPLLLGYREDGITPYCIVWKDGVKAVKV